MKKSIFTKAFAVVIFAASLFSCSNLADVSLDETIETGGSKAYITLGSDSLFARDIKPAASQLQSSNLTDITLKGKWQGGTEKTLVPSQDTGLTSYSSWTDFESNFPLAIQTGNWIFTLTASLDGTTFSATLGTLDSPITISKSGSVTPLDFTLVSAINYGGLSLTVNLDLTDTNISSNTTIKAIVSLTDSNDVEVYSTTRTYSNSPLFFSRDISDEEEQLSPGVYNLEINFTALGISAPINTYKDKVHIAAGITTTKTLSLKLNPVYDVIYVKHNGLLVTEGTEGPALFTRKAAAVNLPDMEKLGYTFLGWFTDDTAGTQVTEVSNDTIDTSQTSTTYYARFTPRTDTVYHVNHWQQILDAGTEHNEDNYEAILTEEKKGSTDANVSFVIQTADINSEFLGFDSPSASEITAAQALTILPNGTQEVNLYYPRHVTTVSYDDNVASQTISVPASTTPHYGQTVTISNTEPTRTGYTFTGWTTVAEPTPSDTVYKKGTEHTSITAGLNNVTFYAQWSINSYEVSFETNGGSEVATQTVIYNNYAEEPSPAPTKPNYIFAGWYKDEGLQDVFTFSTTQVYNAMTLYAKWNPIYTKIEVKNGNTVISSNYYSTLEATMQAIENIPDQKDVTITYYAAVENADNIGRINQPSTILGALCVYDSANSRYRFNSVSVIVEESADIVFTSNQFADFFSGQGNLVSVDLSGITTNNITDIQCMFKGCENLTSVTFGETFSTSNVSNMTQLFCHCTNLTTVDITSFRADSLQYTEQMFANCTNLESIYVSSTFDLSSRSLSDSDMFMDCSTNLQGTKGTVWTSDKTGKDYARIDGGTTTPGYFSRKPYPVGSIVLKDGTILPYTESLELTATQQSNAIAVIFYDGKASDTLGAKTLGIGLKMSRLKMTSEKDPNDGTISVVGYNRKLTSDDNDGKVFLQAIQECSDYEEHAEDYYPAIYWVANYKNQVSNLSGSSYDTGWYIPAKNEMLYVYNNVAKINEAFLKINESIEVFDYGQDGESQTGNYWTAVQDPNYGYECGIFKFWVSNGNGNLYDAKDYGAIVKKPFATAIHEF